MLSFEIGRPATIGKITISNPLDSVGLLRSLNDIHLCKEVVEKPAAKDVKPGNDEELPLSL
jgi:hypothetical protein